ncbi:unnamed protein product [Cylicocyclus nassatus]|uniref:C-type lectin domain-containing protein n=1 Tax=Cylicocyclus nassatus TaxID=53992 RepID=A0AA36H067_CYLNA|nr:unnamed protein product [Cylicocyclus nassatus]
MKFLLFAILPLAEAWLYSNSSMRVFRSKDQSTGRLHRNLSNTAHFGPCESGWTYFDETDACYKNFFWETFLDAENICKTFKGHLTSIHSFEENSFVAELAKSGFPISDYPQATWIGLARADYLNSNWTAKWIWTDGTKVDFLAWSPIDPDNADDQERCVLV